MTSTASASALTAESISAAIDIFDRVRHAAYEIARADGGAAMGGHQWLRNALNENDMQIDLLDGEVLVYGDTFTSQTQGLEGFHFTIPMADILAYLTPQQVGCLDDPEATVVDGVCHHPDGPAHPVDQPRTTQPPAAQEAVQSGQDRYIVARITEADQRANIYGNPDGTDATLTLRAEQVVTDLDPKDLQALNLWDEATALAQALNNPTPRCGAHYGTGNGASTCTRAQGHPAISDDGIGHSDSVRHQGL